MRSCAKAILLAVKMEGGEYEWVQHVPIAISLAATQAQGGRDRGSQVSGVVFQRSGMDGAPVHRAGGGKGLAGEPAVREALGFLSRREIVELLMTIGFYLTAARITETTRTDLDPPAGTRVIDQIRRAR